MDQRFSRYAIASIALAVLVPIEVYANIHVLNAVAENAFLIIERILIPSASFAVSCLCIGSALRCAAGMAVEIEHPREHLAGVRLFRACNLRSEERRVGKECRSGWW